MSSRLFIARIIPMLLLLLGGFGMAVADTGGGVPKKEKGTVFSVVDISVTGGGSTSGTIICAGGQTVILEPSLSSLSSTSSVSFTILRGTDLPITATVGASPYTLNYVATGVSGPTGLTVIARDNSAFPSTFTKVFSLVPPPTNVVTASSVSICQGSSVTFTQAQSTALTLLPNGATTGGTGTTSVVTTPSATGPQTFSFTGVDLATGCSYTSTVSVNIVANPTGTIVASPNPVCAGQPVSFSVNGTGVTSVIVAGATPGTSTVSPFISTTTPAASSPSGTSTVSYTLTGAGGCTAVATASYSVVALPSNGPAITLLSGTTNIGQADATATSQTLTPSGSVSVCQNSTLTLSLSGCAAVSGGSSSSGTSTTTVVAPGYIIITSANGTQITVANGITSYALPTTATGTSGYQVACYNSLGCSSTAVASFTLTVNPTPAPPTVVSTQGTGSSFTICSGRSFSATIGCPTGETANASSGGTNIALAGAGANVFNTGTGTQPGTFTYAAICRNASCTSVATNFTLVVIPSPTMGPSVTVNSEAQGIISTPPLPFVVTNINASAMSATQSIIVCQNSVLSLSVANCSVAGSNSVTNPITEITSPGTSVGVGASVTAAGGGLIDTYVISTSNVTPSGSGPFVYSIVCTNANGCSSTAVAVLNVTVLPAPTSPTVTGGLVPGGTAFACIGTPLSGTIACPVGSLISLPLGNGAGLLYSIVVPVSAYTFTPTVAGTQSFSIYCYDGTCQSRQVSFTVVTNNTPAAPTGIAASLSACLNSPVNVTAVCTSSTAVFSGAQSLTGNTQSLATSAAGTFAYSVVCSNGFCQSAPLAFTLTVQPRPANASLTAVNGMPASLLVPAATAGAVTICQGLGSLTVLTNCVLATASSSNSSNVATGNNSGMAGVDGMTAAAGGGTAGGATSTTFASFAISTTATGTTNFTFVCVNQFGCASPQATSLAVTVNASAVAPTSAAARTVCESSGNQIFATGCGTNTAVIFSRPAIDASSASIVSNSLVLGTVLPGTYVYGIRCQTSAGCSSTTTSYTLVVNNRPNNANLTVVNGTTADRNVSGGQLGSVSICQGASLTVNTNCLVATGSTTGAVNPITGINSGSTGTSNVPDGTTASQGGGTGTGTTSSTFAGYTIATTNTGVSTYTFVCVNAAGCTSPETTSLIVTVNATPAAPTFTGTQTACQNSNALSVAATCSTPTGVSLVIRGASGIASIADVNSTTATGTRSYTLQCVTPTCASSTTTVTVIVRPLPANAGLTVTNAASQTLATVPAAGSGTVAVCQGQSLTVITSCVINTSTASGSSNVATGVSSGSVGQDGSVVAIANGVTSGTSSVTYAAFVISTSAVNTTTFTFRCQNEFGCTSPDATTLALTVSASVASPTLAGTFTACQNSGLVSSTNAATSLSSALVSGACSTPGSTLEILSPTGIVDSATLRSTTATTSSSGVSYTLTCVLGPCRSLSSTTITKIVRPLPTPPSLTAVNAANGPVFVGSAQSGTVAICQQNGPLLVNTDCVLGTVANPGTGTNTIGGTSGTATAGATGTDGGTASVGGVINNPGSSSTFASFTISTANTGTNSYTFTCVSAFGCTNPTTTTLTVTVNASVVAPAPIASVTVCQNSGVLNIPAVCSTASSSAVFSGAQSFTGSPLSVSTTVAGLQTYQVICRTATCSSTAVTFTVFVNPQPANAAVTVTTSAGATSPVPAGGTNTITICEGTSLTGLVTGCPTTSGNTGGSGAPITGSGQVSVGGSSPVSTTSSMNTFTIPGSLTAGTYNYTVVCTSVAGSVTCTSPMATSLVVVVNGAPVSPTANYASTGLNASTGTIAPASNNPTSITTCQNSPTSLTVFGCNAGTAGSTTGVNGQTSGSAVLGGSQIIAGSANNSFFTIPNTTTGSFQYTIVCTNPTTGCSSLTPLILNIQVNPTPAPATIAGGVSPTVATTVCQNIPLTATLTCPTGSSVQATAALGAGTSAGVYTVPTSATGTTTYSVTCISTSGGCPSPARTFVVTVNPIPANAGLTVSPATLGGVAGTSLVAAGGTGSLTICQGNPISVTVTGCDVVTIPGSTSGTGTSSQAGASFGGVQTTAGSTVPNVFTVSTANTGVFTYTAVCTNMFGCTSPTVTTLNVTVNPTPGAPTVPGNQTVCLNQALTATITCPTGSTVQATAALGAGTSAGVYTVPTGTAGSTTYSVTCIATQGGCPSAVRTFAVTVNPLPNNASLTAVGGTPANLAVAGGGTGSLTICQNGTLRVNTDCQIGSVSSTGTGNSLTGVNSGNSGGNGVIDNGTSSSAGVGGGTAGGGTTTTFASFNLGTSIATTTTYTFVCVNQFGCASPVATTLAVTVNPIPGNPAPVASAGVLPNLVVCETASGVLSITTGCTGTNVAPVVTSTGTLTGGIVAGTNTYTISTATAGATVSGAITFYCSNTVTTCRSTATSTVNVTVVAAPAAPTGATIGAGNPAFATTSSLTICQGQPVSLTVNGCLIATGSAGGTTIGGTGTGFIFTGTGFTFTPTGPTTSTALVTDGNLQQGLYTFVVRCTNASGCQSLSGTSFSLVVTGQPSAVAVSGFAPTCAPNSVTGTLGCSAGTLSAGYRLTNGTGMFTSTGGNVMLPMVSGNYTVTAVCTTGGACLGTPVSFTVNNMVATPAPISVQTVQNAICLGQSTTLVAVCQTAGSSAIWYLAGTTTPVTGTAAGATSLIVAPLQQGTYNYEAVCTDPNFACASTRSTQIVLNVLPGVNSLPTISAQPNPTVAGQAVTLTGAGCTGTTIFYIQGTNTEVGRGMGGLVSLTVNPQVTTIYDAVCSNGQCTSNRTTGVQVFVTPCNFVATVTPSSAVICATGGSVQLTASGGVSYVWNNGQNTQQITVSAAGVYNVVVTSAQGCTAMASATITTGTAPSPTITGNTNIFAGQSTTLTAGGGGLYAWNGPGLAPNAGGASQVVSQPGTYVVTVTSPTGCTASASVVVTNIALPPAPTVTPTAAVQPNATLQACVGQTVQLVASCPIGSTPRFKTGTMTNNASTENVTSSTPGTILYNVVCVANGVEGPSTFAQVVFNGVPTIQILQTGVLCTNTPSSATLSATGAASYTWSTGQVAQSIVVNSNATGLYSVNGANAAGCVGTASQMVSATTCGAATVMTITGATIDCVNGNVTIAATGGNGNQKQYSIGGVQYSASNPVALDPAFQNNPANSFIQLFVRQVNSTNTGFDVAGPFQFNFRAVCPVSQTVTPPPSPTTTACNSPTNTFGQTLVVTGVTDINCLNGSFRVLTTGGNGSAIDFSVIVGLSNVDANNCIRKVDNGEQLMAINNPNSTITPFRIDVMQNGVLTAPFFFDFKQFCTGQSTTTPPPSQTTTPPPSNTTPAPPTSVNTAGCGSPANTIGQPLTITNVDQVNCAAGTFRILTTGGSGNTINYANIVGLSNADPYNCTRTLDNPDLRNQVNNPNSTIAPFQLRVVNVGGATSNTYSFNFKQACTGVARTARTEGSGTLDVTVLGNPTLGETVEVEVRGAEGQALQLRLVDGLGAAISEKSVEKAGATERQTISLGRSAGMYFLQVTTPDKSKTVKVVRQ